MRGQGFDIRQRHRHSYLTEDLVLSAVEKDVLRDTLVPKLLAAASMLARDTFVADPLIREVADLKSALLECLPEYLRPRVAVSDPREAMLKRWQDRKEELEEIARTTKL